MNLKQATALTSALDKVYLAGADNASCRTLVENLNEIFPDLYFVIAPDPDEVSAYDRVFGVQPRGK